jgi:hypothetical protein
MKPQLSLHDRWRTATYWLSWLTLLGSLLCVVAAYGSGRVQDAMLYNADAMFIPVFFRDITTRGTLAGWDLPTSPFFFPDMALFFPLLALIPNIHLAALLFGLCQLLLIIVGLLWLQRQLFGTNLLAQTILLLTLSICLLLIATGKQIFYAYALMSVHHMSVLVVLPFATVALLRLLQPEQTTRRRAAILLYALILLTSFSESLFIIQFVLPALLATLAWGKRQALSWRYLLLLEGGILLSAAAGQWLRHFIVPLDKLLLYAKTEGGAIAGSFWNLVAWLTQLVRTDSLFVTCWLLSTAALMTATVIAARQIMLRPRDEETRPLALVATLCLVSMGISVVAVVASGNFVDAFSTRYLVPLIYLPFFTGLPLLLPLWLARLSSHGSFVEPWQGNRTVTLATGLVTLLMLLVVGYRLATGYPLTITALTASHDPLLTCLEQETEQRNLHDGIAGFWQANSISALSEGRLHVLTVNPDLSPYLSNNNRYA